MDGVSDDCEGDLDTLEDGDAESNEGFGGGKMSEENRLRAEGSIDCGVDCGVLYTEDELESALTRTPGIRESESSVMGKGEGVAIVPSLIDNRPGIWSKAN